MKAAKRDQWNSLALERGSLPRGRNLTLCADRSAHPIYSTPGLSLSAERQWATSETAAGDLTHPSLERKKHSKNFGGANQWRSRGLLKAFRNGRAMNISWTASCLMTGSGAACEDKWISTLLPPPLHTRVLTPPTMPCVYFTNESNSY